MKRISKDDKIWTPDEVLEDGYEPLLEGEDFNAPVVLELTKPTVILEEETTELTISPPTTAQMLKARTGKGSVEKRSVEYFAQCCNVPLDTIAKLHARDFNRIGMVIANFTE